MARDRHHLHGRRHRHVEFRDRGQVVDRSEATREPRDRVHPRHGDPRIIPRHVHPHPGERDDPPGRGAREHRRALRRSGPVHRILRAPRGRRHPPDGGDLRTNQERGTVRPFALGTVFLAAALAEAFRIPAIVGAFFMGMVFADTHLAGRLKVKMESLRDAFVAIFFLSFGMLIDPSSFSSVVPMLLIAAPLILLNDLFLTAALAYFIGFSGRASTAIGTSMIARNEEAILYATVGARAIQANPHLSNDYAAKYLTPFARILCIVMSSLQPILMGRSDRIAASLAKRLPKSITFGAEIVKRTLKTGIMPTFLPIYRRKRVFQAALIAYSAWIIDLTITTGPAHLAMSVLTPILIFGVWASARHAFQEPVRHTNYGVDGGPLSRSAIETFVLRIVVGALAIVSLVAILWQYYWPVTLPILYAYFLVVVFSMKVVYRRLGLGVGRRTAPIRLVHRIPAARSWRAASGRR